jgi:FdhE protein
MATATIRVMSPEEIAASAGGETPPFHWPEPKTVFAERRMRLTQLARGHAMADFLLFAAELARAQQAALDAFPSVPLPDAAALDRAAQQGVPPLPAVDWPRDAAWRDALNAIVADLRGAAPAGVQPVLERLEMAGDDWLERQADALLTGVMAGLDLAAAPIVAAALQVYWTHLVAEVRRHHSAGGQPFARLEDAGVCPCCGSRPTASITRTAGGASGQRYLHCALCGSEWHLVRSTCTHCGGTAKVAYQSLEAAAADDGGARAAQAAVQAETCDDCGHYLKILHTDREPFADPVADDLATLTLDLLVSEAGLQRHGINLLLLFGEPDTAESP